MTRAQRHPLVDAVLLSGSVMVALGLARFSYGLVLPSMRSDLQLSFALSGGLGTANTFGYLVGVVTLPWLLARIPPRTALLSGSAGVTAMLFATMASSAYLWLVVARFSTGFFGASANLVGLSLAAKLVTRHRSALVVFNAGVGISIVITGAVLPSLLADRADRWPVAWVVFGALGVAATIACSLANVETVASNSAVVPLGTEPLPQAPAPLAPIRWLAISYVCFGSGYIVYITFLIATLKNRAIPTHLISSAFVAIGAMCLLSPLMWGRLQRNSAAPVLLAVSMTGIGVAGLLLILDGTASVFASVIVFGLTFMAAPTFVTATIRSLRPETLWTSTISRITIPFGIAQAIAPWLSGAGVDQFGTSFAPLWTATCCALGAFFAVAQFRSGTGNDS